MTYGLLQLYSVPPVTELRDLPVTQTPSHSDLRGLVQVNHLQDSCIHVTFNNPDQTNGFRQGRAVWKRF